MPVIIIVGLGLMYGGFQASAMANAVEGENFFKGITHAAHGMGITLDLGITIAVIGTMLALFPVINTFYVQPLESAINERNSNLEKTFTEAENLRSEMTQMRNDYETRLTEADAAARAQIQAEIKKAQDLSTQMQAEVATQKEQMLKRAQEEINSERDQAITGLRTHAVNLTLAATEKLIGAKLDNDTDRKLIQEFIDKAEVPTR